jgi:hypothetical protein
MRKGKGSTLAKQMGELALAAKASRRVSDMKEEEAEMRELGQI